MSRMVRALSAIAVVTAALCALAASGEPTWESKPSHGTVAAPGEPTWEHKPVTRVLAAPVEPTWEVAPAGVGA
ncbi:hypothetical protein ACFH04_27630 [Streptomyces noboritoensis]|uniref:Uncharacterized protein n=1 Tax=Streptomyces noboritoensis TaxID=67337 RepID=A0ABV6TQ03_9ACTN